MVTSDDNSASTSFLPFFDKVYLIETFPYIGLLQLLSKIIVADSACVDNRFRRKNILKDVIMIRSMEKYGSAHCSSSGSILSCASGDKGDLVLVHEFIVAVVDCHTSENARKKVEVMNKLTSGCAFLQLIWHR